MSGESERRAGGKAMEANRAAIGKQIKDDLSRIVSISPRKEPLKVLDKRGAQPAKMGRGDWKGAPRDNTGGGIASPLTEEGREYYPTGILSSDGLFQLPVVKAIQFLDADGEQVVINLKMPGT